MTYREDRLPFVASELIDHGDAGSLTEANNQPNALSDGSTYVS